MKWLSKFLNPDPSLEDEPVHQQREVALRFFTEMRQITSAISDDPPFNSLFEESDEMPGGSGPFGLCPTNPIPVNAHEGNTVYLERLRTIQGQRIMYHRIGSVGSSNNLPGVIDEYEILAFDGSVHCRMYFNMYFPRRSRRTPEGFVLRPWSQMDKVQRLLCKLHTAGISNFAIGFPDSLVVDVKQIVIDSGFGEKAANGIVKPLAEAIATIAARRNAS